MAPDKSILLDQIDTNGCSKGKARVKNGTSINIHQFLCKTFCPSEWIWVSSSDETCLDLNSNFELQNYHISHIKDENGNTNYSIITASYGQLNSNIASFKFIFTTQPNMNWYCYEMNTQLHSITCANDV
jgi:hypothetical protein